jgi:threonine synthase
LSKVAIEKWGWYNRNAAINPHLVEGKKTISLEIAEQMKWEVSDWMAVSVGDGCTIGGVYKGFYDLYSLGLISKIPKILGVQSDGCCPFYDASKGDGVLRPTEENTLADSISVGIPRNPKKGLDAVEKSNGTWITVTDEAILEAMKTLGSSEGMFGEPAGVTGLAGVIKAVKEGIIKPNESVSMIISGNGLKDVKNALKAAPEPIKCEPNIESLSSYME